MVEAGIENRTRCSSGTEAKAEVLIKEGFREGDTVELDANDCTGVGRGIRTGE